MQTTQIVDEKYVINEINRLIAIIEQSAADPDKSNEILFHLKYVLYCIYKNKISISFDQTA